jgi:Gas vesicle synthesis protein GvpL/GvpF
MPSDRVLIHAYGVMEFSANLPEWPPGIADARVETVAVGPTTAITSVLPSEKFEPSAWERHAEDATWLGSVAAGHHRVLQAAIAAGDVVPFRLPSLYGGLGALRHTLNDHAAPITQAMERIRGRVEWAVKLYRTDEPGELDTESEPVRTGSDYLIARSREMQSRVEADTLVHDRVRGCYARISEISVAAVRNAPQDPLLSGRREPMVLNAAFLVDRADQATFHELIDEIAQRSQSQGLLVEVSGPWPAYNFASIASFDAVAGQS